MNIYIFKFINIHEFGPLVGTENSPNTLKEILWSSKPYWCRRVSAMAEVIQYSLNSHVAGIDLRPTEHQTAAILVGYVLTRKEGNVLFNDALNTFHLRLYGVRHMVKDHSDSERGNPLLPHGLLFPINVLTRAGVWGESDLNSFEVNLL